MTERRKRAGKCLRHVRRSRLDWDGRRNVAGQRGGWARPMTERLPARAGAWRRLSGSYQRTRALTYVFDAGDVDIEA